MVLGQFVGRRLAQRAQRLPGQRRQQREKYGLIRSASSRYRRAGPYRSNSASIMPRWKEYSALRTPPPFASSVAAVA